MRSRRSFNGIAAAQLPVILSYWFSAATTTSVLCVDALLAGMYFGGCDERRVNPATAPHVERAACHPVELTLVGTKTVCNPRIEG